MTANLFTNANNFVLNSPHIITIPQSLNHHGTSGLDILLDASIPEAAHDSSARYPPARCHPGTRQNYIDTVVQWGSDSTGGTNRILWIKGPAGVGKSAVAQSCAEALRKDLGASFFFSRQNERHDPNRFFTSISYQLAMKHKPYRHILDTKIRDDPTIVSKSIGQQFHDLIAVPLQELKDLREDMDKKVIIIDGLDECISNDAQCDIIDIIAVSVRDRTTPFLWAIFSRAEPRIVTAFTSDKLSSLSLQMEIPVSREVDHEIALYLTDELEEIRKQCDLPSPWPTERQVWSLVDLSAGLFVYAATIIRFVAETNCFGPDSQLLAVLSLAKQQHPRADPDHPLAALYLFYTLILQRIPPKILSRVLKILLVTTFPSWGIRATDNANLLGLTQSQFKFACRTLHSVLYLEELDLPRIRFYHASFMDFLRDSTWSKEFCINSACARDLRSELLGRLNRIHTARSLDKVSITWGPYGSSPAYQDMVEGFFILCQSIALDAETLAALERFNYEMIPILREGAVYFHGGVSGELLFQNIPEDFRQKVIRPLNHLYFRFGVYPTPEGAKSWKSPYILGRGKTRVLFWRDNAVTVLRPFPRSRVATIFSFIGRLNGRRSDEDD